MRRALLLVFAVLGASCGEQGTSILIEVRSELTVPDEIDRVRIEVEGSESGGMLAETLDLPGPFPQSYRLHARSGHESEAIQIAVFGLRGAADRVSGLANARFVKGTDQTVIVTLDPACLDVRCPPGVTCSAGMCSGGSDAGTEDADTSDAGCTTDCDDGVECTNDRCEMGACVNVPVDSICPDGLVCHVAGGCGEVCTTDAECDDGAHCTGREICQAERCVSVEAPECDDGVPCTIDRCDEDLDACANEASDAACDDGEACNGLEACDPAAGCLAGTPLDCDDGVDCTDDSCAASTCVYVTRDADMDGYGDVLCPEVGGLAADDCDDSDPAIRPGAPEVCSGVDEDCDGTVDEGFGCAVGEPGMCTTTCGSTGTRTCNAACSWSVCAAPPEICNGADDDCDGSADEEYGCVQGEARSCATTCGTAGTRLCDATCTLGGCTPPAEICEDGIDQDCDGVDPLCTVCPGGTDAECDDGLPCNGVETCLRGTCAPGTPLACDDGVRCTIDTCVDTMSGCVFTPDHAFCADGNYCNGAEVCDATLGCLPGAAPSCDDADGCTDDACVGTMPGMCVSTTRDLDRDRHGDVACAPAGGLPADDCDDTVASTYPGAPELCNGVDDDCDVVCDDGFACCQGSSGSCTTSCGTTGSRVCSSVCSWGICSPPAETCNGIDDDCNGACDDAFPCCRGRTGSCLTSCGSMGSRTCDGSCGWGACENPVETCNGVDDDCDTLVDEGFTCRAGATGSCTTSCGSTGSRICTTSCEWGSCVPPAEECNGLDDDCDGIVDEGFLCAVGATRSCASSCGTTGSQTCSAGCGWGVCVPPAESCNGIDDDCNTFVDDGFTCAVGATGSCTTGCGTTGSRTCGASCEWGACTPPAEVCNGADDDCDTLCDDGFTCCRGRNQPCTTSCGSTGSQLCGAGCGWGACMPPVESCNGADDDCDGTVDDGFACAVGATGSCTTSCGTAGSRTCSSSCGWGTCQPPVEACNAVDDDCDGTPDDGFACVAGSTGACTTSCGTTGSRRCDSSTCTWGACDPPPEACNGIDDDCDMIIDETLQCVTGTTGSCSTSCGSTGTRTCGASCTWGGCTPPAESCNGADDDCDGSVDDGFTCPAGSSGSCATSCGSTGTRTCSASCSWGSCTAPAESCNGADDDCDGTADDGFACVRGTTGSCTTACGSTGARTCSGSCTWGACSPPAEICNGVDDDCDTLIDEGFTCAVGSTGSCLSSCGTTGSRTCTSSCGWGTCVPPAETCNGTDDDCDGLVDDGFTCAQGSTGTCTTTCSSTGTRTCSATCGWGTCRPPAESCNAADDDCDGTPDEDFVCVRGTSGSCLTTCGSTGSRTCTDSCAWGSCLPPAEACNGSDDDCDGFIDDGFTCARGSTQSCTTSCGSTGTQSCGAGCTWGTCTPPTEICNGVDDDCDMMVDEGFTCTPGSTRGCSASCGTSGSQTCTATCTWGTCNPPTEVCNAIDDDCDTLCDDGFSCCQGSVGSCPTTCGTTGSRTCGSSCTWGSCVPPAEVCNGADDDCDTVCDDGFACCQGSIGSCTTGCGSTGSRSCSGTCTWGTCVPPAEVCDGDDDDCDSVCDNGFACCAGATGSCTTSCGSTGSRTCSASCGWGSCTPPAETCNGADDDCDGSCDDGFTCCAGTSGSCTTSCGSTGTRTCSASCAWGSTCTAPPENCTNGVDDDCDGRADAMDTDCMGVGVCSGSTTITAPGGRFTAPLVPHVHQGTCGGAGAEAFFNFTLSATSDVFLTTHMSDPINTVLYVRRDNCTGTQVGCNGDADGRSTSTLRLTSLTAGTYNVFVDTVSGVTSGTVTLDAYISTPGSASDRCGNPTFIAAGATSLTGSIVGYTNDYTPAPGGSCTQGNREDRVYYFYLPTSRSVTFNGCASSPYLYDQVIYVRNVCSDGALTSEAVCNDDDGCGGSPSFCDSGRYNSAFTRTLGPGLYYFFVDGYFIGNGCDALGSYSFSVTGL